LSQETRERRHAQRRQSERFTTKSGWTVSLDSLYAGEVNNLSAHGVFVKTSNNIPVDSIVHVEFPATGSLSKGKVSVKAKVVWSRKDRQGILVGIGVEFIDPSEKQKDVISYYIDIIKKENDKRT